MAIVVSTVEHRCCLCGAIAPDIPTARDSWGFFDGGALCPRCRDSVVRAHWKTKWIRSNATETPESQANA